MLFHRLDAFHLIVFLCANVSGPPHSDRSLSLLRLKPMRNSKTTFSAFCVLFRRLHFFVVTLFSPIFNYIPAQILYDAFAMLFVLLFRD